MLEGILGKKKEGRRERGRDRYIYIYIERERERRGSKMMLDTHTYTETETETEIDTPHTHAYTQETSRQRTIFCIPGHCCCIWLLNTRSVRASREKEETDETQTHS